MKKERQPERVDWDNLPSPNPRYQGMTVKEAVRVLLKAGKKKPSKQPPDAAENT